MIVVGDTSNLFVLIDTDVEGAVRYKLPPYPLDGDTVNIKNVGAGANAITVRGVGNLVEGEADAEISAGVCLSFLYTKKFGWRII